MAFCGYKYKYYLNMSHSINEQNPRAGLHYHTLDITLYIQEQKNAGENFLLYEDLEREVEQYFSTYEGVFFNELPAFERIPVTIEHIGDMFFTALKRKLKEEGYILSRLEISETPARVYAISDFLKKGYTEDETDGADKRLKQFIQASLPYIKRKQAEANLEAVQGVAGEALKPPQKNLPLQEEGLSENPGLQEKKSDLEKETEVCGINGAEVPLKKDRKKVLSVGGIVLSVFLIFAAAAGFCFYLMQRGDFPFGQEAYMVLGRAEYLYGQLCMGRLAPMYMENWYNGYQFFVTSPPTAYYLLVLFRYVAGDMQSAYYCFTGFALVLGAIGWMALGRKWKNLLNGVLAGMLWILMPAILQNYVFYGTPLFLLFMAIVPYTILALERCCEYGRTRDYILMGFLFFLQILTDTFYCFLLLIALSVYGLFYGHRLHKMLNAVKAVLAGGIGILLTGPWLFVAVHNGALSAAKMLSESFTISLFLLIIAVLGLLLGNRRSRIAFWCGLLFWGLSACGKLPFAENIPLGLYAVNSFYAVVAVCFFLLGLIQWKGSRMIVRIAFFVLLVAGGVWQSGDWFLEKSDTSYESCYREIQENGLLEAVDLTDSRMLYLELDSKNSFLPYYVSGKGKGISSTYRIKDQNAKIEENLLQMENALYNGYYAYVFDRAFEGGYDTIVIGKNELYLEKNDKMQNMLDSAEKMEYNLFKETDSFLIFHRFDMAVLQAGVKEEAAENEPVSHNKAYGIATEYKGIAIGKSAVEIAMLFPAYEEGISDNIEDYTVEELSGYEKVILMGFTYNTRERAEAMVRELADMGVQVYIDMSQAPIDPISNRRELLDVSGQVITFEEKFHSLIYKGKIKDSGTFLSGNSKWDTVYLDNLDEVEGYSWIGGKRLAFCGTKGKIHFLSMNLIYHGVETGDEEILSIIYDFMEEEKDVLPKRTLVPIEIEYDGRNIIVESPQSRVNTTWAYQNTFASEQKLINENHYLVVDKGRTVVEFAYGQTLYGTVLTGIILVILFTAWQFLHMLELEIKKTETENDIAAKEHDVA